MRQQSVASTDLAELDRWIHRAAVQDPEQGSVEREVGPAPDPDEFARWREWLEAMRVGAGERIAAARREMQAQGALADEGKLTQDDPPADMRPGSTSSVSIG